MGRTALQSDRTGRTGTTKGNLMTATTTLPHDADRTASTLLRMAAILAVIVILTAISFVFGRESADTTPTRAAVTQTFTPSGGGCVNAAHTPPC